MLSISLLEAVGWVALSLVAGVATLCGAMWLSLWRDMRRRKRPLGPKRFPDNW